MNAAQLSEIRQRIQKAKDKRNEWSGKVNAAIQELKDAKNKMFLASVKEAMDRGITVRIRYERSYIDMNTLRHTTTNFIGTVQSIHRGRKHHGLWVVADGETQPRFVYAYYFNTGYGATVEDNIVQYPAFQSGDR